MKEKMYDRQKCLNYANKWALLRNPDYYDYEKIGGDCTNFASQCIYAGSSVMNFNSWYYRNANDKSPSWTGVEFLYKFLIQNKSVRTTWSGGSTKSITNRRFNSVICKWK